MKYMEQFKEHYKEWFRDCSAKRLVDFERNLGNVIDSDLIEDFVLCDEVIALYDMVRDECVYRVAKMVEDSI